MSLIDSLDKFYYQYIGKSLEKHFGEDIAFKISFTIFAIVFLSFSVFCLVILNSVISYFENFNYHISEFKVNTSIILGKYETKKIFGKEFILKTNKQNESTVKNMYNDIVVYNYDKHIIHNVNCPYARSCTKNCIYMERVDAEKIMKKFNVGRFCNFEGIIAENCEKKYEDVCKKELNFPYCDDYDLHRCIEYNVDECTNKVLLSK